MGSTPYPARTITVALDMSKAFDTINIHTLIRKLLQTNIPGTQSLNSSQTTSRNAKPTQHIETTHPNNVNFKLSFHEAASFLPHYLTFTPQTYHHPVHGFRTWPTQMTSPLHLQARAQPRNIYNHTFIKCLPVQNNLILNSDKTTCTLFTPDPAENWTLKYITIPMATHQKVMGLTSDPKLTYSTHIHAIAVHAHKPLQIIKINESSHKQN